MGKWVAAPIVSVPLLHQWVWVCLVRLGVAAAPGVPSWIRLMIAFLLQSNA